MESIEQAQNRLETTVDGKNGFFRGVTWAKRWIPVEEELPFGSENSIRCLVKSISDGIVVREYNQYHKCWDDEDGDDYYCDAIGGNITHWRPIELPEACA